MNRTIATFVGVALAATAAACSGDEPSSLKLLAYESFPVDPDDALVAALDDFTADTGIDVEIVIAGDTGTMLSSAALTAGNPEGDVIYGIDNTFLSRAIDAEIFEPYEAEGVGALPQEFRTLVPNHEATPVDFGDVCLNYDVEALERAGLAPPASLADLTRPEYAGTLVVENPATSSPGLAFLLATIAEFGDDGWEQFWADLRANDVQVVDGWSEAYYGEFSFAGGNRPIVVSYGSSPPFEVLFATEPMTEAPTAVVEASCFRQVEFAGVLRGTDAPEQAGRLVDFLISERFQREIPLSLFVFPVNPAVELQTEFVEFAAIPDDPITLDPQLIDANRTDWIERWNAVVLR
ncbi:MAG: thiamine ABC transporter substrate-binding protein [Ilumatobacter sp.]|nr:thiamine ABC transporter substrate-binding protein [Ilumatobacter sp.]